MKNRIAYFPLIFIVFSLFFCKTSDNFVERKDQAFLRYTLNNGIPLVIKKNKSNRIYALSIGLKGQVLYTPYQKAGMEGITLQLITKGSQNYSYEVLQKIFFEKSSALSAFYGSFDYSAYSLFTLDKYFDELFPIYMDCFLHPAWDEKQFKLVLSDMKIKYQQEMSDPYARMVTKLHDLFFKSHPYLAYFGGTEESLQNITLDDVKNYFKTTFAPERMYVVAVGNFDEKMLLARLNETLGALPRKGFQAKEVPPFAKMSQAELYLESFPASQGVAFVRADFPIPGSGHKDYPALVLACAMLDDLMFEIVRIQHGAAYGMWINPFSFKENYASIVIYKTAVPEKVKNYIDQGIALMLKGQCLGAKIVTSAAGKGGIGDTVNPALKQGSFVPIQDALEFYKAQFITGYYGAQESNSSIAAQILVSLIYSDDPGAYLDFVEKIKTVTSPDIIRVVRRYFYDEPKMWIVLSSDDVLKKINREDYLRFLAEVD
jgi:zinc protease